MARIDTSEPVKTQSPDGRLSVAVAPGGDGRSYVARLSLAGRTMATCRIESRLRATGTADVHELVSKGDVLAREIAVGFSRGKCAIRIANGCIAVSATGDAHLSPTLPRSVSFCLAPVADGRGFVRLGPAECRHHLPYLEGLVMYGGGECALVRGDEQCLVVAAASSPCGAILPPGLRHALTGLGAGNTAPMSKRNLQPTKDAAFNVTAFFLDAGYVRKFLDRAGLAISRHAATFARKPTIPSSSGCATKAHAKAYTLLASPGGADAATAFRGEVGEYVCGARRKGRKWYIAGFTSRPRVLTLFFPFLEDGVAYNAKWMLDEGANLPTNAVNPTPPRISAGDKATVMMCANGGFVVCLEPTERC